MIKNFLRPQESYLVLFQLIGLVAALWGVAYGSFSDWVLSIFVYLLIFGLGITVTFHRLLAHKSYRLWKPLEYLFSFFANVGCTGSSVGWVFVHRAHHAHTDKPGDPHSPAIWGKWGAIVGQYGGAFNKWSVRDIINDPVHRFYHDYHLLLIMGALVGSLLISFEFAIFGYLIPVFLNTAVSRLSNWIDHEPKLGSRPVETADLSHNVWWWSLVSLGEGWHHNHHTDAANYRLGRGLQFDPGSWLITGLMKLGLASPSQPGDWRDTAQPEAEPETGEKSPGQLLYEADLAFLCYTYPLWRELSKERQQECEDRARGK